MAKYVRGIDVSIWEPKIDWEKVCTQDIHFALIKATEANFADPLFATHWAGAKRVGILRGAFHFIDPRVDARTQAQIFLKTVKLEEGDLPPILDLEDRPDEPDENTGSKKGGKAQKPGKGPKAAKNTKASKGGKSKLNASDVPNAKVIDIAETWLEIIEKEMGKKPILYSSPSYLHSRLSNASGKPPAWSMSHILWLANYLKKEVTENDLPFQPAGWSPWTFWQYSDRGLIEGITADDGVHLTGVDLDFYRGSLDDLYALAGAKKPDGPIEPEKPVEVIPKEEEKHETPPVEFFKYIIKKNDTLSGIAFRFHTTVPEIMAINPQIKNPNIIIDGATLNIPN